MYAFVWLLLFAIFLESQEASKVITISNVLSSPRIRPPGLMTFVDPPKIALLQAGA
jgi:hypothetical protein